MPMTPETTTNSKERRLISEALLDINAAKTHGISSRKAQGN